MLIHLLGAKIQQLIVTESSESYSGSVSFTRTIAGIRSKLFEQVHVNNLIACKNVNYCKRVKHNVLYNV